MSALIRHGLLAGLLLLGASGLRAAVPAADGLFPCGGKAGSAVEVTVSGKIDPWPPKFWCSNPKVTCEPAEKAPKVTLSIAKDAPPGPALVRFWNGEGSSEVLYFLVGSSGENEVVEDEKQSNNGLADAQQIPSSLPAAVYGRLNPSRDVDCYRLSLKKGQRLFAGLEGYTFRTGLDSILHLYDSRGNRVALAHDGTVNPDPVLTHEIERDGNYTLAVMAIATPPNANVTYHGGTKCSYRLNVALRQKDLPARILSAPGKPDHDPSKPLTPPVDVFGTLAKAGEEDALTFAAKAKQKYEIEVRAFPFRFPTDPVFVLKKGDGTVIREVDDARGLVRDGSYLWTAPADENYVVAVRDRFGKSGADFRYNLRIRTPEPSFGATVDKSNYLVEAGKDSTVKVTVARLNGHKAGLKLSVEGLPDGVTFEEPGIPEKAGDVSVKLKAEKGAKAFSGPVTFRLEEVEGEKKAKTTCHYTFQGKDARGPYLVDEVEQLWLTVKAEPDKKDEASEEAAKK